MNSEIQMEVNSPAISKDSQGWPIKTALFLLNVAYIIWFLLGSAIIASVSFPVVFIRRQGWRRKNVPLTIRRFIQFYGRWIIRFSWPMIRLQLDIPEEVKQANPCVYVLNHFSFADVYFCGFLPGFQTVIAVRAWPFRLPIYNIFMRLAGYINVEEKSAEDVLASASEVLKSGACLLFFPEGHRSRDGHLMPLQKGAFRIAAENQVPLVPVAIEGTEHFGGYKSRLPKPCRVKLRFFTPLYAGGADLAAVNQLRNTVKTLFLKEVYNKRHPQSNQPGNGG